MKRSLLYRLSYSRTNLILQCGCTLVGVLLSFLFWERIETRAILTTQFIILGVSLVLIPIFALRRREPSLALAATTYFLLIGLTIFALWLSNNEFSHETRPWTPFLGHRAFVFVSAIIAPARMWIGVTGILAFGLAAVAQYLSWSESVRANIVVYLEPWHTLAFVFYALILFVIKLRAIQFEHRMARARIRSLVTRKFAHRILALKDLTNSPLFTMEMILFLLRKRHPEDKDLIDPLDSCIEKLESVNRLVQRGDDKLCDMEVGVSFDVKKRVKQKPREAKSRERT